MRDDLVNKRVETADVSMTMRAVASELSDVTGFPKQVQDPR